MASPPSAATAEATSAALDPPKATTTTDPAASSMMDLSTTSNADAWQKCLDNAINAIVNIRVLQVKPFEATGSSSSYATGFVVSLEHNLILSKYARSHARPSYQSKAARTQQRNSPDRPTFLP